MEWQTYYYCLKEYQNRNHYILHKPENHDKVAEKWKKRWEKVDQEKKEKEGNSTKIVIIKKWAKRKETGC